MYNTGIFLYRFVNIWSKYEENTYWVAFPHKLKVNNEIAG